MTSGGFTLVDFSRPMRDTPLSHPPTEPLLCKECKEKDLVYFDPYCDGCQEILLSPDTTIPQIFAVMRQWVPQIQQNISSLTREVLRRGAHVNDKDGLSDLSLLHYAVKSGADGVGRGTQASSVVQMLVNKGADCRLRCHWTDMNSLHYAAFFNVESAVDTLLDVAPDLVNTKSSSFNNGTALHIAALNMSKETLKALLSRGADPTIADNLGKIPVDYIPDAPEDSVSYSVAMEMKSTLEDALARPIPPNPSPSKTHPLPHTPSLHITFTSEHINNEQDNKVVDKGGFTPLSPNAPIMSGEELSRVQSSTSKSNSKLKPKSVSSPKLSNFNHVVKTTRQLVSGDRLKVGDRVIVGGQKSGIIQYSGPTKFATGWWFGVELDEAQGKNDGSVNGERYFTCSSNHGVFAPPTKVKRLSENGFLDVDGMATPSGLSTPNSEVSTPSSSRLPTLSKRRLIEQSSGSGRKSLNKSLSTSSVSSPKEQLKLKVGMNVFVHGTMATVRYIGKTDFADGMWLGVEFRSSVGRHNGTVKGKTYFSCKHNHGLFIKPNKATFRGISCANLIS